MPDLDRFFALLSALHGSTPADAEFLFDDSTPDGALRLGNLRRYLALGIDRGCDTVCIGEAPGYRGMTVTGVPFTSVRELGPEYRMPPHPAWGWELSASVVTTAYRGWPGPAPISWSVYPNHPFRIGEPFTNRAPRPAEVRAGTPIAVELLRALEPSLVIAIGRKAEGALAAAGIEAVAVRHPAQGGAGIFAAQMAALAR